VPPHPRADWPGAPARPPVPLQWAEPAPGQAPVTAPWPAATESGAVATAWPDRWSAAPDLHHGPADAAGTTPAVVVGGTTRPAAISPPEIAFDDRTGPWPDLPPIDLAVPGTTPASPAVPAHGPFDRARVARLDAEQLGQPLDRAR
jgi:hypothetical protein